jgi:hypothetical protein
MKNYRLKSTVLIPIAKDRRTGGIAKFENIKKPEKKPKILLPPPLENYIRGKEHDFL